MAKGKSAGTPASKKAQATAIKKLHKPKASGEKKKAEMHDSDPPPPPPSPKLPVVASPGPFAKGFGRRKSRQLSDSHRHAAWEAALNA